MIGALGRRRNGAHAAAFQRRFLHTRCGARRVSLGRVVGFEHFAISQPVQPENEIDEDGCGARAGPERAGRRIRAARVRLQKIEYRGDAASESSKHAPHALNLRYRWAPLQRRRRHTGVCLLLRAQNRRRPYFLSEVSSPSIKPSHAATRSSGESSFAAQKAAARDKPAAASALAISPASCPR